MAFISMNDVSVTTGVTPRALRVWESEGLLGKVCRDARGFRQYSEDQVALVKAIVVGQTCGLTLQELKAVAKNWNVVEQRKMRYRLKELFEKLTSFLPQEQEYDL